MIDTPSLSCNTFFFLLFLFGTSDIIMIPLSSSTQTFVKEVNEERRLFKKDSQMNQRS